MSGRVRLHDGQSHGELPQRYRPPPELLLMPLGEGFERRLEAAKRGYDIGPNGS